MVHADKADNNNVFGCKAYYYNCILNEFGINSTCGTRTYTATALSKNKILQNHISVLNKFKIPVNETDPFELPYLYWIPKLKKKKTYKDTLLDLANVPQSLTKILIGL